MKRSVDFQTKTKRLQSIQFVLTSASRRAEAIVGVNEYHAGGPGTILGVGLEF